MKKVTIIVGHPIRSSLSGKLAESYKAGATAKGSEVKVVYLGDLKFDPILRSGYEKRQDWEPDLKATMDALMWADHWVFVTPIWWGSMTTLMKGFIERTFLPKITFEYLETSPFPKALIQNKSARVIITMDSPLWYYKIFMGNPVELLLKRAILGFCGLKPVNFTYFGQVRKSSEAKRNGWLDEVKGLGEKQI